MLEDMILKRYLTEVKGKADTRDLMAHEDDTAHIEQTERKLKEIGARKDDRDMAEAPLDGST